MRGFRLRLLGVSVAFAAAIALVVPFVTPSAYAASVVIGAAGTNDPTGERIPDKLQGIVVPLGATYQAVNYPASFWPVAGGLGAPTFNTSVGVGVSDLLIRALATTSAHDVLQIVGYSQGAVVANKVRTELRDDPTFDADFILMGNPNRPNGGIFARFPGLYIPVLDVYFNGAVTNDRFDTLDIVREYDPYGDFPAFFNPLSIVNALLGIRYAHPDRYYDDLSLQTVMRSVVSVEGNTAYSLVRSSHLPLLQPLRDLAAALGRNHTPLLDAIEPVLKVLVDMGYDRTTSPGTPTPFRLFTPPEKIVEALKALPGAIQEGLRALQPKAANKPIVATQDQAKESQRLPETPGTEHSNSPAAQQATLQESETIDAPAPQQKESVEQTHSEDAPPSVTARKIRPQQAEAPKTAEESEASESEESNDTASSELPKKRRSVVRPVVKHEPPKVSDTTSEASQTNSPSESPDNGDGE